MTAVRGNFGNLEIIGCEFRGVGQESGERGVVFLKEFVLTLLDSRFVGSVCNEGGIVNLVDGYIQMKGCEFVENRGCGGVLSLDSLTGVESALNLFRDNEGTAVYLDGCRDAQFEGDIIEGNQAPCGGGFQISNRSKVTLTGVYIQGNKAGYGGGVYLCDSSKLTLNSVSIRDNKSVFGGGILVEESRVYGEDNELVGNTATETGGGMLAIQSDVELKRGEISKNRAKSGGFVAYKGNPSRIFGASIAGNSPENTALALLEDFQLPEEVEVP
jgi:hypothetical protein